MICSLGADQSKPLKENTWEPLVGILGPVVRWPVDELLQKIIDGGGSA